MTRSSPGSSLRPGRPQAKASVAIVGGGISGLAAAYELARSGRSFTLFEASGRLGGIVETVICEGEAKSSGAEGRETGRAAGYVIECGPDSWPTAKPWARELALKLGLDGQIIGSNDRRRTTYLVQHSRLSPLPEDMRLMVPVRWEPLLKSPLLSWQARLDYLREPGRAAELRAAAPKEDEPVSSFIHRHFGEEAVRTLAGPLLSGIFGGDIRTLSARAVMPELVRMEAEHGSLILALREQARAAISQPIFSTLETGLGTLIDCIAGELPAQSVHLGERVLGIEPILDGIRKTAHDTASEREPHRARWKLLTSAREYDFDTLILATPPHVTRALLPALGEDGKRMAALLPQGASSAIVVALAFDPSPAKQIPVPTGFGFLAPPSIVPVEPSPADSGDESLKARRSLLACTFVDQKFHHRAPQGGRLFRVFFGGPFVEPLLELEDERLAELARVELALILSFTAGPAARRKEMPRPTVALVRRWPLSLPQYAVGHLDRIAELETLAAAWPTLGLVGSAYRGVGISDLIREGGAVARRLMQPFEGE